MASQKLDETAKRFIVESLARFETPSDVAAAVKTEFGVELKRNHVEYYDPTKVCGQKLRKDLKELFEKSRALYIDGVAGIGIAQTTWRLERLQRGAVVAMSKGNWALAAELMKQAAQDKGGLFTNKQVVSTRVDGTINHEHSGSISYEDARDLPADELARRTRDALGEASETKRRW